MCRSAAHLRPREGVPEAHHGRAQREGLRLQHLQPPLRPEGHLPRPHGHPPRGPARPQRAEVRLAAGRGGVRQGAPTPVCLPWEPRPPSCCLPSATPPSWAQRKQVTSQACSATRSPSPHLWPGSPSASSRPLPPAGSALSLGWGVDSPMAMAKRTDWAAPAAETGCLSAGGQRPEIRCPGPVPAGAEGEPAPGLPPGLAHRSPSPCFRMVFLCVQMPLFIRTPVINGVNR